MEKLRCNSPPFFMLHHRAILYIVRTRRRRRSGLRPFLSFLFLTKYRSSHQWCTLVIMRLLSTKNLTIYKTWRWCERSPPDFFFVFFATRLRLWLETVNVLVCVLVGTELEAEQKEVSLKQKQRGPYEDLWTPHFSIC